jgi:hypothetical protein
LDPDILQITFLKYGIGGHFGISRSRRFLYFKLTFPIG